MAIRRMYLFEYLKPAEIAIELNLPEDHFRLLRQQMVTRGLPAEKRKRECLVLSRNKAALDKQDASELATSEAFALQAEELVEKGFKLARDTDNARDFKDAASGTRSYLDVYRQSRGLVADQNSSIRPSGVTLFFVKEVEAPTIEQMKKAQPIAVQEEPEPAGIM